MSDDKKVTMILEGSLFRYLDSAETQVAAGQTVREAATGLGIPEKQVLVAVVNGKTTELTHLLQPGDRVKLIPPIAGG